jgi:hypothetical protein
MFVRACIYFCMARNPMYARRRGYLRVCIASLVHHNPADHADHADPADPAYISCPPDTTGDKILDYLGLPVCTNYIIYVY